MANSPAYDVFVSYAEADRAWVEGYLLDALTVAGVRVHLEAAFALGAHCSASLSKQCKTASERSLFSHRRILPMISADSVIFSLKHTVWKRPPGLSFRSSCIPLNCRHGSPS